MAEKIKFRLTAAKMGVSAALLVLIGGVAEKLRSSPGQFHLTPAASTGQFLKLGGITGNVKTALIKLEDKWIKLDGALTGVVHKLSTDYLKIDKANAEFLKIEKAHAEYLEIDGANAEFLKIQKANGEFLKIRTADAQFLKIADAHKQFVEGRGGVVSSSVQLNGDGKPASLLTSPDGSLVISLVSNADGTVVQIKNTTGALLPAVQVLDGATTQQNLQPGINRIPLDISGNNSPAHQLQLQTFGDGSVRSAMTLVLSTEGTAGKPGGEAVAQMLIGLL